MDINLSRVVTSPRITQVFNVYRSSGRFDLGGWVDVPQSPLYFEMRGVVYPAREKELKLVPEGDRPMGAMCFITKEQLMVTNSETPGPSDEAEYEGEKYKIVSSLPYGSYGYYLSVGTRSRGE